MYSPAERRSCPKLRACCGAASQPRYWRLAFRGVGTDCFTRQAGIFIVLRKTYKGCEIPASNWEREWRRDSASHAVPCAGTVMSRSDEARKAQRLRVKGGRASTCERGIARAYQTVGKLHI